jgi:sugar lactone lactonase YvrE
MPDLTQALRAAEAFDAPAQSAGGLAWDGSHLWLSDFGARELHRVDPITLAVTHTLQAHGTPAGLAWDGTRLWQAVFNTGVVVALDPERGEALARLVLPESLGLIQLAGLAWDGTTLWCACQQRGKLCAVDIALAAGECLLHSIAPLSDLAWDGATLWACGASGLRWDGLAWEETENAQYVLVCLDPGSGDERERYPLPFWPMGLTWAKDDLWISDSQHRKLHRVRVT